MWAARRLRCEPAVLLFCVVGLAQSSPNARQPALSEVLAWLPDDTETITGANGPFHVPDFEALSDKEPPKMHRETRSDGTVIEHIEVEKNPVLRSAELVTRLQMFVLGLFGFKNGGLVESLKSKTVVLAVEGSRHFRTPAGLGLVRYEGCEIVVFSGAAAVDRDSFMKKAASSAKRFEEIEGVNIAVFEEELEKDLWTTFVAFPRNNVVLVATDADFLRTVLTRMRGAGGRRALPESLPEWKYVNTSAPAWGVRHYQKGQVSDPTSPFNGAGPNEGDDKAVGVAFSRGPAGQRTATVTYLSASSKARQTLAEYLSSEAAPASPGDLQINLGEPAPGVIQGSVRLSKPEDLYKLLFGLGWMLGHGVVI